MSEKEKMIASLDAAIKSGKIAPDIVGRAEAIPPEVWAEAYIIMRDGAVRGLDCEIIHQQLVNKVITPKVVADVRAAFNKPTWTASDLADRMMNSFAQVHLKDIIAGALLAALGPPDGEFSDDVPTPTHPGNGTYLI